MRIALIYPPPWKIPAPGELPDATGEGPPAEYEEGDLDGDFFQTPYGLFALGAPERGAYKLDMKLWGFRHPACPLADA